jgi:hypothetical protein
LGLTGLPALLALFGQLEVPPETRGEGVEQRWPGQGAQGAVQLLDGFRRQLQLGLAITTTNRARPPLDCLQQVLKCRIHTGDTYEYRASPTFLKHLKSDGPCRLPGGQVRR